MSAVFGKEFKNLMRTMVGPIFIAFVLFWFGYMTSRYNLGYGVSKFEYAVGSAAFISLIAIPLLTMRSFSEERHNGSDKLLYSLPVKTGSIVIGKYLSALAIFAIPVAIISIYPFILSQFGTVYLNTAYSAILAFFILGASLIAIGIFISSLTESQVIAAIFTLMAIFIVAYIKDISSLIPSTSWVSLVFLIILAVIAGIIAYVLTKSYFALGIVALIGINASIIAFIIDKSAFEGLAARWLSKLAFFDKLDSFFYGKLDITVIIFYLSIIVFFLFLTSQAVEKKRWS